MGSLFDVVIAAVGRPSLGALLDSLSCSLPESSRVFVVDNRRPHPLTGATGPLAPIDDCRFTVLASLKRGAAAARNVGWRNSTADWVVFLDDDVDLPSDWVRNLEQDLAAADDTVAAIQGNSAALAVRRSELEAIGGFDERRRRFRRGPSGGRGFPPPT